MSDTRQSGLEIVRHEADNQAELSAELRYELGVGSVARMKVLQRIPNKTLRKRFLLESASECMGQLRDEIAADGT